MAFEGSKCESKERDQIMKEIKACKICNAKAKYRAFGYVYCKACYIDKMQSHRHRVANIFESKQIAKGLDPILKGCNYDNCKLDNFTKCKL